jgi:hypothetical protein
MSRLRKGWKRARWIATEGRRETGRYDVRTVELALGPLRIVVTRYLDAPGWQLVCRELGIERHTLTSMGLEDAKREAIGRCRKVAKEIRHRLDTIDVIMLEQP